MFGEKKKAFDSKIVLWDKAYDIDLSVDAESTGAIGGINENYNKIISEKQEEIEKTIEDYYIKEYDLKNKHVLVSEFNPTTLIFEKDGKCVLLGFGPENGCDEGFALMIRPKLDIMTQVEYLEGYYLDE